MAGGYGTSSHGTLADRVRASSARADPVMQLSPARHCFVDGQPSLLVEWRQGSGGWEGQGYVTGYRCHMDTPMPFSRAISLLTLLYGVFAAIKPRHLADGVQAGPNQPSVYDQMAYTYAGRDLAVSGLAIAAKSRPLVVAAMGLRIAADLTDAAALGLTSKDSGVRRKVLGVTLGWASLNAIALAMDLARKD